MLRTVEAHGDVANPYLESSPIISAGHSLSANLVPAMLSILYETCANEGWLDYPILPDTGLNPIETSYISDGDDDDDDDDGDDGDEPRGESSGEGSGSNYTPSDQNSSPYGSPDSKGKRVTKRDAQGGQQSKRMRKGNTEPVSQSL
jgi:hypothetical protein